jgi:hypothetical protein
VGGTQIATATEGVIAQGVYGAGAVSIGVEFADPRGQVLGTGPIEAGAVDLRRTWVGLGVTRWSDDGSWQGCDTRANPTAVTQAQGAAAISFEVPCGGRTWQISFSRLAGQAHTPGTALFNPYLGGVTARSNGGYVLANMQACVQDAAGRTCYPTGGGWNAQIYPQAHDLEMHQGISSAAF